MSLSNRAWLAFALALLTTGAPAAEVGRLQLPEVALSDEASPPSPPSDLLDCFLTPLAPDDLPAKRAAYDEPESVAAAAEVEPACCESCVCPCDCGPRWYAQFDALFLDRTNRAVDRAVVLNDTTGDTILSVRDLDFNGAAGPRLVLGRQLDDFHAWEALYFGTHDWDAFRTARDENNLDIPPDLVVPATDFDNADVMKLSYGAELHNAELNYLWARRGNLWNGVSLLAGFRYVDLEERFNINSLDNDGTRSDYTITARNRLYGGQIGLRAVRRGCRWGWDFTGKAGVFGNDTYQQQFVGDEGNTITLRDTFTSNGVASFVGDLNTSLQYKLTDVWSIRGGYNVLWIEGVSLAADQLDFGFPGADRSDPRDRGGVFMHGANVGLEARW